MKKLSHRDWAILLMSAIVFITAGWAAKGIISKPEVINIENPVNNQLKKSNDSLEAVVAFRDSLLKESEKRQAISDSIIINNHRNLKNEYEKIKNFTPESRLHYVDSVLRAVGFRR